MSEEQEKNQSEEVYNDHSVDNSVHHAVNLWPIPLFAAIFALTFFIYWFVPDRQEREKRVPNGKAYSSVGQIVDCQPVTMIGNGPYRSFVRTPKDEIFSVYWRRDFQPPMFGAAIGGLKYHECGVQDGVVVHCFDSFAISNDRVKVLDFSPKPTDSH